MVSVTFENPVYLWYLLSVPALITSHFYFLRYTKHKGIRFANFNTLQRVSGNKQMTKNHPLLLIRSLILVCLILSVAGTAVWYKGPSNENDFVIAIDVSASMTSFDIEPTRLEAARKAAMNFVDGLDNSGIRTKVGVVSFSGSTYIDQTPTDDLRKVKNALDVIDVRQEGGTDITGAIITSTNLLVSSEKGKTIILISDGSVTVTPGKDRSFQNALEYAANQQVIVHTLGLGTNSGPIGYLPEYYNASAVFNEETLIKLANSTYGTYTIVNDQEEMEKVYNQIGNESYESMLDVQLSYGLLLLALFLIFLEWGLVSTKFRRLP